MALPLLFTRPQLFDEKPAIVQMVNREDAMWNRPVFRAPPLRVEPPDVNPEIFKILATPVVAVGA
jgi:hypothetical protein